MINGATEHFRCHAWMVAQALFDKQFPVPHGFQDYPESRRYNSNESGHMTQSTSQEIFVKFFKIEVKD